VPTKKIVSGGDKDISVTNAAFVLTLPNINYMTDMVQSKEKEIKPQYLVLYLVPLLIAHIIFAHIIFAHNINFFLLWFFVITPYYAHGYFSIVSLCIELNTSSDSRNVKDAVP
jgi:hypothetical protein